MRSCIAQRGFAFVATWLFFSAIAWTAPVDDKTTLPNDPTSWINAPPLSLDSLRGKGIVLWFFEEQCPRCAEKWPNMVASAKKFDGKPVIFMAVNSGNPRAEIVEYAQENKIPWPIVVDPKRELEKKYGVDEISLQNIYQAKIITADGRLIDGRAFDVEALGEQALVGASWTIDPTGLPESLRPAWAAVEFNNDAAGAAMIKKGLVSPKPDVKSWCEKLLAAVQKRIESQAAEAKAAREKGNAWEAYRLYNALAARYVGYDLPADAVAARKELASDPAVKSGLQASKNLEGVKKLLAAGRPNAAKSATVMLKKIMADVPNTDIAAEAQALLEQLEKPAAG